MYVATFDLALTVEPPTKNSYSTPPDPTNSIVSPRQTVMVFVSEIAPGYATRSAIGPPDI